MMSRLRLCAIRMAATEQRKEEDFDLCLYTPKVGRLAPASRQTAVISLKPRV